jgi:UDP-N-acetylglucosamine/UDP-N-acetylgalactosamine diphosphorylase
MQVIYSKRKTHAKMNSELRALLHKHRQLHLIDHLLCNPLLEDDVFASFKELDRHSPISFESKATSCEQLLPFTHPLTFKERLPNIVSTYLRQKKIACIILAGGDGSRLGSSLPKGCFSLGLDNNKSLFEIHCSKLLSLKNKIQTSIPLLILTSKNNHFYTKKFFEENDFFGLEQSSVEFLVQPHLPFFKEDKSFFKNRDNFASGPNGNGVIFQLLQEFIKKNSTTEVFQIINVDNPLAYPIDLELLQMHLLMENELTLRCIPLSQPHQNVGRLYEKDGKIVIVDYTADPHYSTSLFGSINIFAFSKSFVLKVSDVKSLPLHWVKKTAKLTHDAYTYLKGELFITDAIGLSNKTTCIATNPNDYFAPLKSLEGQGNLHDAQQALLRKESMLCKGGFPFDPKLYYSQWDLQPVDSM